MRNPLSKALWSIGLAMLGVGLVLLATAIYGEVGEAIAILGVIGLAMATIFSFTFLWALLSAIVMVEVAACPGRRRQVSGHVWSGGARDRKDACNLHALTVRT